MAKYARNWPVAGAIPMHSSNPEPFTWDELQQLTGEDLNRTIQTTSLNYESTQGNPSVREQLSKLLYKNCQSNHVALVSGAQEGIFVVINSLLNAGDEIVTFTPCFEPLATVAHAIGAKVNTIALNEKDHWSIPWDIVEQTITTKTQLVVINFPHNPTGKNISQSELERLVKLCEKNDCWLFSDEVFRGLEHDDNPLPAVADIYLKGISMGVMSKSMALPGIRLGWLVTQNPELIQKWLNIKNHLSICQSSLDAQVTNTLLPHAHKLLQRNLTLVNQNKALVHTLVRNHANYDLSQSNGSATVFVQLKQDIQAEQHCLNLLKTHKVYLLPNLAFMTQISGFRLTLGKKNAESLYQLIFKPTD